MTALPSVTLAIEWDNARDVSPRWVARHLEAITAELRDSQAALSERPLVTFLHDADSVDREDVRTFVEAHAPKLSDLAEVEIVAVAGGDYFALKNAGVARARTEVVVITDCDTFARPGWLKGMLEPFADPNVAAVAGFSAVYVADFLSRVMALSWIFRLPSEAEVRSPRNAIHANNLAVRVSHYRDHPLKAPPGAKKGGMSFLRAVEARGRRWVRAPVARLDHAPHPSAAYFVMRGWRAGIEQDAIARAKVGAGRRARIAYALRDSARKAPRALSRVFTHRSEVGLPLWQTPAAFVLALAHWGARFVAQLSRAQTA